MVAVGTTVVRTLEAAARAHGGAVAAGDGETDLCLLPGDAFRVVTDLITNFHLPRSTLLMLVAAFAGARQVLAAYREAIERGYRFYSYGDAMLIREAQRRVSGPRTFRVVAPRGPRARRSCSTTAHGAIETPVFMPVGTQATVKALSSARSRAAAARASSSATPTTWRCARAPSGSRRSAACTGS